MIQLHNITYRYADTDVFSEVSIDIEDGTMNLFLGPNGGGKTTLLRLIAGLEEPHEGYLMWDGISMRIKQRDREIGLVPQYYNKNMMDFPATVSEVVKIALFGVKRSEREKMVEEALTLVGMIEYADRPIGFLSGGQQQRVMIAQAMVNRPKLLVLDEPFSGMDQVTQADLMKQLVTLQTDTGITIVMVAHTWGPILDYANQVAWVDHGIHFCGKPNEFRAFMLKGM